MTENELDVIYKLQVLQHPVQGRMCGFATGRDKRLISPPLIVQLHKYNGLEEITLSPEETADFVCHAKLVSGTTRGLLTSRPKRHDIVGSYMSGCEIYFNENDKRGCYFIFPDIGVASPGSYCLECSAFRIVPLSRSPVLCKILTNPFEIYSPNAYPGSLPPTRLTRHLVMQGAQIHISNAKRRN